MLLLTENCGAQRCHQKTHQPTGRSVAMSLSDDHELATRSQDSSHVSEAASQSRPVVVRFDRGHEVELRGRDRERLGRAANDIDATGGDEVSSVCPRFGDAPRSVVDADDPRIGRQRGEFHQGSPSTAADIEDRALPTDLDMAEAPVRQRGVASIHVFQEEAA